MSNFNNLTPAETERLALLAEECGEVVQIVGKIFRHGYESYHPEQPVQSNREMLEKELGDVMFAIRLMSNNDDVDPVNVDHAADRKAMRIRKYLHHN